ncbi:MAG: hypothetical protein ACI9S8_000296 [Chlamydiales bacterium]|jgi:hypothetical protein
MSLSIADANNSTFPIQNSFVDNSPMESSASQGKTRKVAKRSFREIEPESTARPSKRVSLISQQARLLRPNLFLDLPKEWEGIPYNGVFSLDRGRAFYFHREVLKEASPVFKAMFSEENNFLESDEKTVIPLNFTSDERIRQVIQYLYTGEISLNESNAIEICDLADMWMLGNLQKKCRKNLAKALRVENCLSLVQNTQSSANNEILAYVLANAQQVLRHESFMKLSPEVLKMILEQDDLNIQDEFQVLDVLRDWVRENSTVLELPGDVLRKPLADGVSLMECIRFENIDMKTLWTRVDFMFLLSDSEMADITRGKYKKDGARSFGLKEVKEKRKFQHRSFYPDFNFSGFEQKHFREKIDQSYWVGENYYWKVSDARRWLHTIERGVESESPEVHFEQENGGECAYKLICERDDEGNLILGLKGDDLKFKAGANGWGGDEEANREISVEFSLINYHDCRKHLHSIKKVEIEDGAADVDELLHPEDDEFSIGVKTLPIKTLLDPRKGWIQNGVIILSARVDIQDR